MSGKLSPPSLRKLVDIYPADDVATPPLLHPRVLLAWRQHTGVAKINKAQIAQPPKKNESEEEVKQDNDDEEEEEEETVV